MVNLSRAFSPERACCLDGRRRCLQLHGRSFLLSCHCVGLLSVVMMRYFDCRYNSTEEPRLSAGWLTQGMRGFLPASSTAISRQYRCCLAPDPGKDLYSASPFLTQSHRLLEYCENGRASRHPLPGYRQPFWLYRFPCPESRCAWRISIPELTDLKNSPVFAKCNVNYVPIFLGGLMNACGNTPPIKIKSKQCYRSIYTGDCFV